MEGIRDNNCEACGAGECMGEASEIAYRSLMSGIIERGLSGCLYVSSDQAYVSIGVISSKNRSGPTGTFIDPSVQPVHDIEKFVLEKLTEERCIGIVPTPSAKKLVETLTRTGAKKVLEGISEYTHFSSEGVSDVHLSSVPVVYNLNN